MLVAILALTGTLVTMVALFIQDYRLFRAEHWERARVRFLRERQKPIEFTIEVTDNFMRAVSALGDVARRLACSTAEFSVAWAALVTDPALANPQDAHDDAGHEDARRVGEAE